MIEEVMSNDYDISETFHKCFANTVPNLKIKSSDNVKTAIESEINPNKRFSFYPIKILLSFQISSIKTSTNA